MGLNEINVETFQSADNPKTILAVLRFYVYASVYNSIVFEDIRDFIELPVHSAFDRLSSTVGDAANVNLIGNRSVAWAHRERNVIEWL